MARYNFEEEKGSSLDRCQYVKFSYNGEIDPALKVAKYIREVELVGQEYDPSKKKFYFILNEKGLFEEIDKNDDPKGIEVIMSYDAKQRKSMPVQANIKGKTFSIEELLESQIFWCQYRLHAGELEPNIGFVYTADLSNYLPYQEFLKKEQEEMSLGQQEINRRQKRDRLTRGFNFGKRIEDPDKI